MSAYRLDPINLEAPNWAKSEIREAIWVGASSQVQAREFAALATNLASHHIPGVEILGSPWQDDRITTCVWYPSKDGVPDKTVLTVNGERLISKLSV